MERQCPSLFEQHDVDDTVIRMITNFMHPTQQTNLRETCRRMRTAIPPPRRMTTIELIYDCAETGYCDLCIDLLQHLPPTCDEHDDPWGSQEVIMSDPVLLTKNRGLACEKKWLVKYVIIFALKAHQWEIAEKIKSLEGEERKFDLIEIAASGDVDLWKKEFNSLCVFSDTINLVGHDEATTHDAFEEDQSASVHDPYHAMSTVFIKAAFIDSIFLEYPLRFAAFFGHTDLCDFIILQAKSEANIGTFSEILFRYGTAGSQISLIRAMYKKMPSWGAIAVIAECSRTCEMWEFAHECILDSLQQQQSLVPNPQRDILPHRQMLSQMFGKMIRAELGAIAAKVAQKDIQEIESEWKLLFESLAAGTKSKFSATVALSKIVNSKKQRLLTTKLYHVFIEEVGAADSPINLALKWSDIDNIPIEWRKIFARRDFDVFDDFDHFDHDNQFPLCFGAIAQWLYTYPPILANITKKSGEFAPNWTNIFASITSRDILMHSMVNVARMTINRLHFALFNGPPVDFDILIERTFDPELREEYKMIKRIDSVIDAVSCAQEKIAHAKKIAREKMEECSLQ